LASCLSEVIAKEDWQSIKHLVIFPTYKEGLEILKPSLQALKNCNYPKDKMIVVVALKSAIKAKENAVALENEFKEDFWGIISTFHPDGLPGETRTKGANATWAAKKAKEFLTAKNIPCENVIISCFDADTCVEKEYFGCLTYHFLSSSNPTRLVINLCRFIIIIFGMLRLSPG